MYKIYCAVVTPFKENLEIDYIAFKRLINKLINDGVDGIIVGGTTGEAPTLTIREKKKLYEFASLLIDKRCSLYFGVGTNDTKETIEFIRMLDNIPCDGYLAVVPYYNKPSQKGLVAHFKKIADSTDKDIWLYNIPSRCVIGLDLESIIELSKVKNIKAIKEASNNFDLMKQIKNNTNLEVYIGEDYLIYDAYKEGLDGVISVAAHIFTKEIRNIMKKKDEKKFNLYKYKFQVLFYEPNPVMIKSLLKKLNYIKPYVRLPHIELDKDLIEKYYKIIIGFNEEGIDLSKDG